MPYPLFRLGRSFTGLGLFAVRAIKRNGYIATYRGPLLPADEADRREERGARYMFILTKRWTIDGSPRWNVARYINHSCYPNATPVTRKGRIVIIALRNISPGEEITYDYGEEYLGWFKENGGCLCAGCRIRRIAKRSAARAEKEKAKKRASKRSKRRSAKGKKKRPAKRPAKRTKKRSVRRAKKNRR
jgi:SET domain-containing protein